MRLWTGLFLMAVVFTAARESSAVEVGVSVGSRHHGSGGAVEFRTGDSNYNTWYPDRSAYVYTQPAHTHTTTTYVAPSYTYTTPSTGYVQFYGSDRYRSYDNHHHHHNNHHNRHRDRDHHHHHRR